MKIRLIGLISLITTASIYAAEKMPFPEALEKAAVIQKPMAAEIPGALILGNGDLNGILWLHQGRLRFSITKNDACDGRLDTSKDKGLCRIDAKTGKWIFPPPRRGTKGVPSWQKPYPCPLICGSFEFSAKDQIPPRWKTARHHAKAAISYDEKNSIVNAHIAGKAGDSAGWSFVPKVSSPCKQVTVKLSGSPNAKWYVDFPGTGISSSWQAAQQSASETNFNLPASKELTQIDLYVWTNDGKPAEVSLHSVKTDNTVQTLAGAGKIDLFQSKLDLARAVGTISDSKGSQILSVRVLANRNVITVETREKVSLSPCAAHFLPASKRGTRNKVEWILTTVPGDVDWSGMSFAMAHAFTGEHHTISVVTSFESEDPVSAAIALANKTLNEKIEKQIASHKAVWNEFWSKSGIELDDPYLESVWYRNVYFLRCFSKPGVPPIGLFMGCATDVMPWHGVATTDYNFEQCFWPAFVNNHSELALPYNEFMVDYLPRGKWFARETYGINGVFYPVNHFNHQINDPSVCKSNNKHMNFCWPYTYVLGANGWQAHNLWLGYQYNPDKDYLKRIAYPVLKEMAIFYKEFLCQCKRTPENKAIYGPSYSPEHRGFGENDTPCDIAWTRFTFKAAIQAAQILDCDPELVKRWKDALALVPDYPLVPKSDPPIISDVRGGNKIRFNVTVPVLPVFPVGEVSWWSPEAEKKLFADTIETISWTGYNSTMILAGARARRSMPGTHEWISRTFRQRQMPSGFLQLLGDTRGNYSEQVAAAGIVSEMLMQSVGGIVRVFPAWPKDKDAKFSRLRGQGGFLVSAEQKGGEVVGLEITSTVGGTLRLVSPWEGIEANGKALAADERGIVRVETGAGDVLTFSN